MKISAKGLDIIKEHEGLRLNAYKDIVGVWTIGYGHTSTTYPGHVITKTEAEQLLLDDVSWAENAVNKYLKHVRLNQNQFDALVSLVFNVGAPAIFTVKYSNGYEKGSSLYNLIILGNFEKAAERFKDFSKAGGQFIQGLYNRRLKEAALFSEKKKD